MHSATEIPAARPLAEIPADGTHVAERGRTDDVAGFGERREPLVNQRIARQIGNPRRRADPNAAVGECRDPSTLLNGAEIDQRFRPRNAFVDGDEQIRSTAKRHYSRARKVTGCFVG